MDNYKNLEKDRMKNLRFEDRKYVLYEGVKVAGLATAGLVFLGGIGVGLNEISLNSYVKEALFAGIGFYAGYSEAGKYYIESMQQSIDNALGGLKRLRGCRHTLKERF